MILIGKIAAQKNMSILLRRGTCAPMCRYFLLDGQRLIIVRLIQLDANLFKVER
jgi:hypothetical protein